MCVLELDPQCKLSGARTSNLIQRIQSAANSAGTKTCSVHGGRPPEDGAGQEICRIAEVWMIENIKEFSSELYLYPLREIELAAQG